MSGVGTHVVSQAAARRGRPVRVGQAPAIAIILSMLWAGACGIDASAADRLAMRIEPLTVPPATGPLVSAVVRNTSDLPYNGLLHISGPDGFLLRPSERNVSLRAHQSKRIAFNIEQGQTREKNEYSFSLTADDGVRRQVFRQQIFVGSAPYFKPVIDGDPNDWNDAIPVTFGEPVETVTVSTFWNRRQFCLLVAVKEAQLSARNRSDTSQPCDAVQVALAPLVWDDDPLDARLANRYEYLLMPVRSESGELSGRCYQLADPGTPLSQTRSPRSLETLTYESATLVVRREAGITYYECALPWKPLRDQISPSEGREFYLGLLVHDTGRTRIRDLAAAAGNGPPGADYEGWCRWPNANSTSDRQLRASRVRWGLCTSKY